MFRFLFALLILLAPLPAAADLGVRVQNGIGAVVSEDFSEAARPTAGFETIRTLGETTTGECSSTGPDHPSLHSRFVLPQTLHLLTADTLSRQGITPSRLEHLPYYATGPPLRL